MTDTPPTNATLEQALALGGTRIATAAHPHCRCHKQKPPLPRLDLEIDVTEAREQYAAALQAWKAGHGNPRTPIYLRRDCPVHAGTAGGA